MSRGFDCNNPMDLMATPTITWAGEMKPTRDPQGRLCDFIDIHHGLRAGALNLFNQQKLHNLRTWKEIVPRFAPSVENDTSAYLTNMCQLTGVEPTQVFDLGDFDFLVKAVHAIVHLEQGQDPYINGEVEAAVSTFLQPKGPAP